MARLELRFGVPVTDDEQEYGSLEAVALDNYAFRWLPLLVRRGLIRRSEGVVLRSEVIDATDQTTRVTLHGVYKKAEGSVQELEVAFYVRRELWSFVQLRAVLHDMDEKWPVSQGPAEDGWSEHRYTISRLGGDEDGLSFVLKRQQPLDKQDAAAALQQLEELAQAQFPTGTRLWSATQSNS